MLDRFHAMVGIYMRLITHTICIAILALGLFACVDIEPESSEPESTQTFAPAPTLITEVVETVIVDEIAVAPTSSPTPTIPPTPNMAEADGYPPPTDEVPTAYPYPGPAETQLPTVDATVEPDDESSYLPIVSFSEPTPEPPTSTPLPSPTPTATPTPIPTLDFAAVRADMNARGYAMATAKIGFHIGPGGNREGLDVYMRRLDEAGVPFFLKTVGDAGPLFEAQEMMKASGVPHVLVYRYASSQHDIPDYSLPPVLSAQQHWQLHMEKWPPELDPQYVWLETINEVDKERSEWLAEFSIETARLAESAGFKWAAFGWSSGEPEVSHWQGPQMQTFLRLAASKPDQLAIALHEYSYRTESIQADAPFLVGRFQSLYEVTDSMGIPRPTVLITEWGWTYQNVPDVNTALEHIDWANRLYAPYPEVKGAAIWYLGPGYDDIDNQTQKLIMPVMAYGLTNAYEQPLE